MRMTKYDYMREEPEDRAYFEERELVREIEVTCNECLAVFAAGGLLRGEAALCEAGHYGIRLVPIKECMGCYATMQ